VDKIGAIRVIQMGHVLQVTGDHHTQLACDRQQLARPIGQVNVRQTRPVQHRAAGVDVDCNLHMALAVVEVLAPAVAVHDVNAAAGAGRIGEQRAGVDPNGSKGGADGTAQRVFAHMPDKGCATPQASIAETGIAAGLADRVQIFSEIGLAAPVNVLTVQVDVGIDADIADHDHFGAAAVLICHICPVYASLIEMQLPSARHLMPCNMR